MKKELKINKTISDKKVSVLIGTFNRSSLISRTFNSILNQSYKNIEIIVIDDCSTDNSVEILQAYSEKYPDKFKYSVNEKNRGIAYNSNRAYEISTGHYLALLGDDDYWIDENKIIKQIEILEEDSSLGLVGTWWKEDNSKAIVYKKPIEPKNWKERLLSGGGIICGSTPLIRKEAWDEVSGFDENQKRGTDSDLFRRIVLSDYNAKILYEVTTVVDVNVNRNRMTSSNNKIMTHQAHINSMKYNMEKLADYYNHYPVSKSKYYENIAWQYFLKYKESRYDEDINNSMLNIALSIKNKFILKSLVKFIIIFYFKLKK
jgi:glycosyltransferase involved in cell wall biosynthesis